jgi:hypothetical protein
MLGYQNHKRDFVDELRAAALAWAAKAQSQSGIRRS